MVSRHHTVFLISNLIRLVNEEPHLCFPESTTHASTNDSPSRGLQYFLRSAVWGLGFWCTGSSGGSLFILPGECEWGEVGVNLEIGIGKHGESKFDNCFRDSREWSENELLRCDVVVLTVIEDSKWWEAQIYISSTAGDGISSTHPINNHLEEDGFVQYHWLLTYLQTIKNTACITLCVVNWSMTKATGCIEAVERPHMRGCRCSGSSTYTNLAGIIRHYSQGQCALTSLWPHSLKRKCFRRILEVPTISTRRLEDGESTGFCMLLRVMWLLTPLLRCMNSPAMVHYGTIQNSRRKSRCN